MREESAGLHNFPYDRQETVCISSTPPQELLCGADEESEAVKNFKSILGVALQKAVNRGYRHFITGLEEGFQLWAIEQLLAMKRHGAPTIECIVPWRSSDQQELFGGDHRALFRGIDGIFYIEKSSLIESAMRCDQIMVGMSGLLITYFDAGENQTSAFAYELARKQGLEISNVYNVVGKKDYMHLRLDEVYCDLL